MDVSLKGKSALVTGASRGIGLAIARALANAGAHVVLADRDASVEKQAAAMRAQGLSASASVCDVTVESQTDQLFQDLGDQGHVPDVLVNNAAIMIAKPAASMDRIDWNRTLETNLTACFFLALKASKGMVERGGGRIINLSSIVGRVARPQLAAYISAKAGIDGMTRALCCEFAGANITVNAIAPGFITTEMSRTGSNRFDGYVKTAVPARRWGEPNDIADVALFLASDLARYVNGQTIYVDGGYTAAVQ